MTDSQKLPENAAANIGRLRADKFRIASFGEGFMWCWNAMLSIKNRLFWTVLLISIVSAGVVSMILSLPLVSTFITMLFSGLAASYALQYAFRKGRSVPVLPDAFKALKINFWKMILLALWDMLIRIALICVVYLLVLIFFGSGIFEVLKQLWALLGESAQEAGFAIANIATVTEHQLGECLRLFVGKLVSDTALLSTMLYYTCIYFLAYSLIALIMYALEFFSLPLVQCSGMPGLKAMWESFKAFSLNIMSITGMAVGFLFIWLVFNSVWLVLGFLIPSLVALSVCGATITTLFVAIFHILIQVNATRDVFWYQSFHDAEPLYEQEIKKGPGPHIATADYPEDKALPEAPAPEPPAASDNPEKPA
jgi:hypothetical protein